MSPLPAIATRASLGKDVSDGILTMLSWPWKLSGLGHFFTSLAVVALAFVADELFSKQFPRVGKLALGAGLLAGCGFMLIGVTHVGGSQVLTLLSEQNPEFRDNIFLISTITRVSFNSLAIVALGLLFRFAAPLVFLMTLGFAPVVAKWMFRKNHQEERAAEVQICKVN